MADEWVHISLQAWHAMGIELFGEDVNKWRYVCPSCGHVQTREDWLALGFPVRKVDTYVGYTCIGRWLNPSEAVPAFRQSKGYGCMYVGGKHPNISPFQVIIPGYEPRPTFDWDRS